MAFQLVLLFKITLQFTKYKIFSATLLGLLYSFYPMFPYWASYILRENNFTFLIVLFAYFYATYLHKKPECRRKWSLGGILVGLSVLQKGTALLLPLFMVPLILLKLGWARGKKVSQFFLLGFLITLLPWIIHNWLAFDCFMPVSSYGGYALYLGNNPHATTGVYLSTRVSYEEEMTPYVQSPTIENCGYLGRRAVRYMFNHPWATIKRTCSRMITLWRPIPDLTHTSQSAPIVPKNSCLYKYGDYFLVFGGLLGACAIFFLYPPLRIFHLYLLTITITCSLVAISMNNRSLFPCMPFLISSLVIFLDYILKKLIALRNQKPRGET